ncbi:sigma 54-interacting transcriptional regulator [Thermosulfurimonas dismutans]|uniref:Nitrogenase (Molybdenum-iron)-specific transcriptional regulator NifA n=1 Tax=Thermosulfurimonas dismutans TaxID=999894 RepID=A0A179D3G8_9BACT|nr:sigma 54-interacting transcriptional regulator [Thermosulfurimonas dismutans]OAQ20624.1 Nitrogenase (molybdenum-iron)-specific transcriptional regulator NifA [Thermosulfurimonas dismutans]
MIDFKILILDDNPGSIYGILETFCREYLNVNFSLEINVNHSISEVLRKRVSISFVLNDEHEDQVDRIIDVIRNNKLNQKFDLVLIDDHWGPDEEYAGQDKILPEVFKKIKGSYPGLPWITLFTKHFYDSSRLKRFYANLENKGIDSERILPPYHKDANSLFNLLFWAIKSKIYYLEALQAKKSAKKFIEITKILEFDRIKLRYNPQDYGLIGNSDYMKSLFKIIQLYAESDVNILITGETGTGKTKIAEVIHKLSSRRKGPYKDINCANLPKELLESELFGHEKGAFTGADRMKRGIFELANGGTIFLDEITEMPPEVQAKLLKAIEEKRIRRVGGTEYINVDVRIIAATNKNIEELIKSGKFRNDLFARFPARINISPLREHKEDILSLIDFFRNKFQKQYNRNIEISEDAIEFLMNYNFPGNIRELEDIIENIFIHCSNVSEVTKKHVWAILNLRISSTENEIEKCLSQEIETDENDEYIRVQDILNRLEEACKKALEQKLSEGTENYCLTRKEWAKYCRRERGGKQGVTTQYIDNIFKKYAKEILELLEKYSDRWPCLNNLKILDKRSKTLTDLKEFCKKKMAS